jgi:hypothetical protein
MPPARNSLLRKAIPGASPTARDYHCPLPKSKLMANSSLFLAVLLTVMSPVGGHPSHLAGRLVL